MADRATAGSHRWVAVALTIGLCSGGSGRAQNTPPPPDAQPPTFRAGVNVVRVDVIVTDANGQPLGNLTADDFEVSEGGKKQKIDTFKLVSLDGGLLAGRDESAVAIRTDEDEQVEAARDDVRLFAMFLDDYHVKKDSSLAMRRQLARFVETQLGPSDMIGLMSPLESMAAVRMTRNHEVIAHALDAFEGRKYNYRPTNALEEKYVYKVSTKQIEDIRNQVSFSAMKALIMHMGALKEGRKALILVSEGYSNGTLPTLPFGTMFTPDGRSSGLTVPSAMETFQGMDLTIELQQIWDLANRNNVAIYTVDPRGLATSEFGAGQPEIILADGTPVLLNLNQRADERLLNATMDTLRDLSEASEGRAIVNRNDLAIGMKEIVIDSSAYYLLGYNSTVAVPDGKFHPINVSLKKRRPGVEVRHRKGYWALKPDDETKIAAARAAASTAAISPVATALASTAVPRGRSIRTWIGTERGDNGRTRVTFVWEPVPKTAGDIVRDFDRPVRVALTALNGDGLQYFHGRVPEVLPLDASVGAGARVAFDVQPGRVQLRYAVEDQDAGVIDSELRDVVVPDLSAPQTTFATPQLFRARTLPELQRLKADGGPVPVVVREFSRSDRLLLRATVYGPATARGSGPTVTASLVNGAGQSMAVLPVVTVTSTAPTPAAADPAGRGPNAVWGAVSVQLEVSLANLPPSQYGISLAATGDGGGAMELVAFRVTN